MTRFLKTLRFLKNLNRIGVLTLNMTMLKQDFLRHHWIYNTQLGKLYAKNQYGPSVKILKCRKRSTTPKVYIVVDRNMKPKRVIEQTFSEPYYSKSTLKLMAKCGIYLPIVYETNRIWKVKSKYHIEYDNQVYNLIDCVWIWFHGEIPEGMVVCSLADIIHPKIKFRTKIQYLFLAPENSIFNQNKYL